MNKLVDWTNVRAGLSKNLPRLTVVGALVALTVAVRLYVGELIVDDAYITFRYAENIAAGHGFVYNVGERVLGTSTPAFTLLLALLARIGIPPTHASYVIGLGSDVSLIIAVALLVSRLQRFRTGIWVAAWAAVSPSLVVAAASGMETELYTALIACSFVLFAAGRRSSSIFIAALVALIRPEGFLVIGSLLAVSLVRREFKWREWILGAAIDGLWAAFSLAYFGSLIPNSVPAKLALHPPFADAWHNSLQVLLSFSQPLQFDYETVLALVGRSGDAAGVLAAWPTIAVVLLLLVGILRLGTTPLAPIGLWLTADYALFAIPNRYMFPWYVVPMLPFAFFLTYVGAAAAYSYVPARWKGPARIFAIGLAALTAVLLLVGTFFSASSMRTALAGREGMYACIGSMFNSIGARDLVVASPEIGALGYEYHGYILDLDGLVSPSVLRYYQTTSPVYHFSLVTPVDVVQGSNPDVVVYYDTLFGGADSPWFLEHYQRILFYPQLDPVFGSLGVYVRSDLRLNLGDEMCPAPELGS